MYLSVSVLHAPATRTWWAVGLALLLALAALPALGQTHDLGLDIVVDAPAITPPGFTGNITFIITNYGPDTAGADPPFFEVSVSLRPHVTVSFEHGELVDYDRTSPISDCRVSAVHINPLPGEPPGVSYLIGFSTLAPGQSATCNATFTINSFAEVIDPEEIADGIIVHRWSTGSPTGIDPNPSNDLVTVIYRLNVSPIPTLQPAGMLLFAVMIVLASVTIVKRRNSGH